MTSEVGFPLQTIYRVTDVSNAYPAVVTLVETSRTYALAVADQQIITFHNVGGMTELNTNRYMVSNLDTNTNTFSLYEIEGNPVDTTNFHTYTSGGEIDIISFPGTPPGLMYNNIGVN